MSATQPDWRLEVLSPDGEVDRAIDLRAREVELGRTAGAVQFSDDLEMADPHARLRVRDEGVEVIGADDGSGVWLRVRGADGRYLEEDDQIWVGSQILVVGRDRERWHLRHHGPDGRAMQLYEVDPPGVFVGRGSDLELDPTDAALSRRHAQVAVEGKHLVLYDRGARNGTFLKLERPELLKSGDEIRIATQHLRLVEAGRARAGAESADRGRPALRADVRPAGRGLAARLRALDSPPTSALDADATDPMGGSAGPADSSDGQTEPFDPVRAPGDTEGEAETALVVIEFEDQAVTLELKKGMTILEGVQAAGLDRGAPIDWECLDGGCGVCVVGVVEGANRLEPPDPASGEMRTIQITEQVVPDPNRYRLACLARVRGTVRLRKLQ